MTALAPLLFWVLAETPLNEWTRSPEELKTVESVWQSLEENDSLNRDIFAYVSHLSSAPALAHVEKAFGTVNPNNALLKSAILFEERLFEKQEQLEFFVAAQTPAAYERKTRIDRMEQEDKSDGSRRAFTYLKTHPQQRRTFLRNPVFIQPTPQELRPLRDRLIRDPELLRALRNGFNAVDSHPQVRSILQAWWETTLGPEISDLTEAYERLMQQRLRNPNTWEIWNTRNRSWAAESPESLISAMYVHARIRRESITESDLSTWTQFLLREPEATEYLEEHLDLSENKESLWPLTNREALPEIPTPATDESAPAVNREKAPTPPQSLRKPDRNGTSRPLRPERPDEDFTRRPKPPTAPNPPTPPARP